jgi:hypothetical protein
MASVKRKKLNNYQKKLGLLYAGMKFAVRGCSH